MFSEYNLHLPPKHFLSTGLDVPVIRERCKLLDNYLKVKQRDLVLVKPLCFLIRLFRLTMTIDYMTIDYMHENWTKYLCHILFNALMSSFNYLAISYPFICCLTTRMKLSCSMYLTVEHDCLI